MVSRTWPMEDAKNRISEMLDAAKHAPQFIIKYGRRVVVVLAAEEYDRLKALELRQTSSFKEHLLNMPKDDGAIEHLPASLREPKF